MRTTSRMVLCLGLAALPACTNDSGEAIRDEPPGATEEVEREHPGLERTEQPIPPSRPRQDEMPPGP